MVFVGDRQVLGTSTGRNKSLRCSTSLPVASKIAGVNTCCITALPGKCVHSPKTGAKWAEGFQDELNGHVFDLEKDGLRQFVPCP